MTPSLGGLRFHLEDLLWRSVDALFPPTCPGCGKFADRWCSDCQRAVQRIDPARTCAFCGEPVSTPGFCPQCQSAQHPYQAMRSWAVFRGELRNALHTLKYKRNFGLGIALAAQMRPDMQRLDWPVQAIVPVPLSPGRYRQRGYNQVALVAAPLSFGLRLPFLPSALRRLRETRSQVGLNAQQRRQNVQNIFQAQASQVRGKTILLMDDVITTGATVTEAASALQQAGARAVYVFSIAHAPLE